MTARRGALDAAIVGGGIVYFAAAVIFRYLLWPDVEAVLDASAIHFVAGFAAFNRSLRATLVPLGALTAVLTLVALLLEGGVVRVWRGRLRIAAVTLLFLAGIVSLAVLEPLERSIIDAASGGPADAVAPLVERWQRWQIVALGVVAGTVSALVLAHRAPRADPRSAVSGALSIRQRTVLVLLGTATLFEGYDRFIVSLALPSIAGDLGASEADLGWSLAAIRAGALLAILIGRAADRFGRRRLLLITILAYTLATGATGLSRDLIEFVLYQIVAIAFLSAELSVAQVVIAEEFPASVRGRGQGLLGAAAGLGAAVALMLFPVMEATRLSWRGLYFVGIAPLLLISYFRRSLPETERWRRAGERASGGVRIWSVLGRPYVRPFTILMLVTATATAAAGCAFSFASYRAVTSLGWSPSQVSAMMLVGGGLGFWGWIVLGRVSDAVGRRPTGILSLVCGAAAVVAFYRTAYLLPAFTALVFFESGVAICVNALTTEIFPTAMRATAKSWVTSAAVMGAMVGFGAVGFFAERGGGYAGIISALAFAPALLAPLLLFLPETRGRELEETSGDMPAVEGL